MEDRCDYLKTKNSIGTQRDDINSSMLRNKAWQCAKPYVSIEDELAGEEDHSNSLTTFGDESIETFSDLDLIMGLDELIWNCLIVELASETEVFHQNGFIRNDENPKSR